MTGARWWRSSASPSSAPSSASRRCRRRSSSATPSSSATASHASGRRSRPGAVPAWRARLVAEATIHAAPALTPEAAGWVDGQVAAVAGKIGPAQLDRLIAETLKRFDLAAADPAADPEDGWQHVDPRHVTIDKDDVHFAGTLHVEADLDLADALDLDRALAHGAATQKALGSDLSLDARRAAALGDLARTQTALDLFTQGHTGARSRRQRRAAGRPGGRAARPLRRRRPTADGQTVFGPTGRLEEGQRLVLLDQLKGWCGDSRTKITVKPVIDLNAVQTAPGYAIPDRIREHVILRDRHLRVPVVHPPRPGLRRRPHHPLRPPADAEGRPQPGPTTPRTWRRCAGSTTASRPTPPGATRWSNPGSSSGPAPTATASDATAPAAPHSTHPTRVSRQDSVLPQPRDDHHRRP